jgi:ABC-type glycerol-3-phosphate transport system permease component
MSWALLVIVVVLAGPFFWMFFSASRELLSHGLSGLLQLNPIQGFGVSLAQSLLAAIILLIVSSLFAFGMTQINNKMKSVILKTIGFLMMIPPIFNLIPLYSLTANMGIIDTLMGLVLPSLITPFGLLYLESRMRTFPQELTDSALIDGFNPRQQFRYLALPYLKNHLYTVGILSFIATWNGLYWPLVSIYSPELKNLPLLLATVKATYREFIDWGAVFLFASICILPTLLLVIYAQRFLEAGLMTGASKE